MHVYTFYCMKHIFSCKEKTNPTVVLMPPGQKTELEM